MQDLISTSFHPLLLGFIGFLVGMISGLLGVGGGVVMTPVLHLAGMSLPLAVGTTLTQMVASSCSGAIKHFRQGNISLILVLIFGLPGVVGIYFGKVLMMHFAVSQELLTSFSYIYGSFLAFLAFLMLRRQLKPKSRSDRRFLRFGPQLRLSLQQTEISILPLTAISILIGFISGLTGLGGGFFFMPIFSMALGLPLKMAVGTSLGIVVLTSSMGAISYIAAGSADLKVAFFLALGSFLGGYLGAGFTKKVSVPMLKLQFAVLVLAAAGSVFLKNLGLSNIAITILGGVTLLILTSATYQVLSHRPSQS